MVEHMIETAREPLTYEKPVEIIDIMLLLVSKRGRVLVAATTKLAVKKYSLIMLALLLITLVFSACGGKGPLPPADKTSPSIRLTSPANGAQNVAINSSVAIKFNEAVDASTINEQTVTLTTGTGNVPGSVTCSDTTVIFQPASSLQPETIYTVAVDGGITDVAGNAMSAPFSYIFITGTLASTTISLSASGVTYNADGIVIITVSSGGGIPTGNVALSVDGGTAVAQELTGGSTAFTIPVPGAGSHTLNAEYAAQGAFGASSASGTLLVNQAATTTAITAPAVTCGMDGIVTVTVSSAAGTPTGNVSLIADGGTPMMQSLINGSTTFTIPVPGAGTHILNAAYAAQGNFGASSASGTLGVGVGATTMLLSAPGVTYGAKGIVTVTVSSAAGTPTGNVSLSVDGGTATTQGLLGGFASFAISVPSASSHTLNAEYAAQGAFGASAAFGALLVNQAATTITITAPAVTYGTDGRVTVMVRAGTLIPTGNVSLIVDGGTPMMQSLINGSTTFTISSPGIGTHTLNATYVAQGNFGAISASGTLGAGPGATTMTLTAPGITYGANGIVTVTVSSATGTLTGNVSLSVDGGTATTQGLINGSSTFTITRPSAGSHTLNTAYAAQGNFGANSASGTLLVNQAATTATITAPAVTYGTDGRVTVTVSAGTLIPTGNVSLIVDGGTPMMQSLINGSTTFTIPVPSAGTHTVNAAYAAQGNFGPISASGTLGVGEGATTMVLSAPGVTYGANGIVTVTVSSAAGTPTGNVSLSFDGGTATTQGLLGGSATFSITRPGAGSHALNAAYAAQGNFKASSTSVTLIVSQASTSTQVTSSLNPSTFGVFVTVTASVTPPMATGTVTFKDYATVIGTGALSGGVATFRTSLLTGGVHSLTAEYGGDTNFAASTTTALLQTVNYAIIATAGPHGSINPSGTVSVSSGGEKKFTIIPDSKHTIQDVRVDGVSQGQVASYTFKNVTANHTIDAAFN